MFTLLEVPVNISALIDTKSLRSVCMNVVGSNDTNANDLLSDVW